MDQKQEDKVKEITDKLEQGVKELFESQKYADYLKVMSKFHNYSFNNSLLIALQQPDATMVAGYTAWQANFHRNVKKGEHGIRILAPSPYKIKKDVDKVDPDTKQPVIGKDGKPEKERVEVTIPAYKVTTVFDVSQTEGEPIPEISSNLTDDVKDFERFFGAIRAISPVPISVRDIESAANGYYDGTEKGIVIKAGLSQAQTLKTAIHEVSHAKLHDKDTGMEKDNNPDRRTKEVQAESVAYTVCSHFGLDTSDYSFGYIAGWSAGKELGELTKSMNVIRRTASEIIKGIDEKLYRAEQEEKIEDISRDIVDLKRDMNPVDFADTVKDTEELVKVIKSSLKTGNTEYLNEWFKPLAEREEPSDICMRAKVIIKDINRYTRVKPSERIADEPVRYTTKKQDVVKHHHRSH